MGFFDELLAVEETDPPSRGPDGELLTRRAAKDTELRTSVEDRIPSLKTAPAYFRDFVEALSELLSSATVDSATGTNQPTILGGLKLIERRIVAKVAVRARENSLQMPAVEDLKDFVGRRHQDEFVLPGESKLWTSWTRKNYGPLVLHLVSDVLTDIEKEFDILLPERNRAVTLSGLVDNADFRQKMIKKGLTWKDPGVSSDHGEFTHRIQWCAALLLMERAQQGVAWRVFREIGSYADSSVYNGSTFGLWDAIVDRCPVDNRDIGPYITVDEGDYRAPENFHPYLRLAHHAEAGSPILLLASFLQARVEARGRRGMSRHFSSSPNTIPTDDQWKSWSKTLFNGRALVSLTETELATLARAWFRLVDVRNNRRRNPIMMIDALGDAPGTGRNNIDVLENAYTALRVPNQLRAAVWRPPLVPTRSAPLAPVTKK